MDNYNNNYQQDYNQGYNQGYDPGYGGYPPQQTPPQKSIKGLKIMIVILAVILGALSVLYFTQVKQMQADYAEARDTLTARLTMMLANYDTLSTENDTLAQHLTTERFRNLSTKISLTASRLPQRACGPTKPRKRRRSSRPKCRRGPSSVRATSRWWP